MFAGTAQAYQDSLGNEPILILTALAAVYIMLGILYESFVHPITILSTLPSAGVGALLALMLFHIDLSIVAIIGIILLIGIVKKNAILMIDFALAAERTEGKSSRDAIYEACLLRFRPILMTTHGGDTRRDAPGARNGHRLGIAPAARDRHHRRTGCEPAAHACTRRLSSTSIWTGCRRASRRNLARARVSRGPAPFPYQLNNSLSAWAEA